MAGLASQLQSRVREGFHAQPCRLEGIDLRALGDGTWDLRCRGRRIARRGDGIPRKHTAVALPKVGRAQPFFTKRNGLSVRVGDSQPEPALS